MKLLKKLIIPALILCMTVGAVSCHDGGSGMQNSEPTDETTLPETHTSEATGESTTEVPLPPPVREKLGINIMSFNCKGEFGKVEVKNSSPSAFASLTTIVRGPKLNKMLNDEQIDIVGFQEMKPDWQKWMKSSLDSKYAYVGGYTEKSKEGGYVAYLKDKFEAVEWAVFWLSDGAPAVASNSWEGNYDRICTWVLFREIASGRYFLVFNTHLDTKWSIAGKGARLILSQAEALKASLQAKNSIAGLPMILVGDMNSEPDGNNKEAYQSLESSKLFSDALLISNGEKMSTRLSTSPGISYFKNERSLPQNGHRIDHIFVSDEIEVLNFRGIYTATNLCPYKYLSDHNAVVAEIKLP